MGVEREPKLELKIYQQCNRRVDEQPDALLVELCERLALWRGLKVSVPTMHRTVQRLGLTTKKNSR